MITIVVKLPYMLENPLKISIYTEKIKEIMPDSVRIKYVHGKMKPDDKNTIMQLAHTASEGGYAI